MLPTGRSVNMTAITGCEAAGPVRNCMRGYMLDFAAGESDLKGSRIGSIVEGKVYYKV
jgi:hypothetical protein